MRQEFLLNGDFNIIFVDWRVGAARPYEQATANARLVGTMLAKFFQLLHVSLTKTLQL